MTDPLHLALTAEPAAASFARARLGAWLHHQAWPGDAGEDIVFAVNELVTNAIEHAYPPQRPGPVDLTAAVHPTQPGFRQIHIDVADHGHWQLTATHHHHHHGLPLVTALMNEVLITSNTTGTHVSANSPPVPDPTDS